MSIVRGHILHRHCEAKPKQSSLPAIVLRAFWIASLTLVMTCVSNAAYAACANPTGAEGELIYNDDHNIMQFCDNTNWIGMSGGSGGGGAGVTDGDKGDVTVSGSGASWMIDDDVLDFTEFSDTMTLDASTTITVTGSNVLTLTNTGTGDSLVVMDQASDTTPFVIAADGKVGIGITTPTQALDVVGKATADAVIYKSVTSTAAPLTGSSMWSTNGTDVWRTGGLVGLGTATPGYALHMVNSGVASAVRLETYGTGMQSNVNFVRGRGTSGAPTPVQSGDTIGLIGFNGNPLTGTAAKIDVVAEETFSASTGAAAMRFFTRPANDTGASSERMRIMPDGKVGINTAAPATTLDVNGTITATNMHVTKPSNYWSGATYYAVSNVGQLDTHGAYEVTLTSNGYRNSSTQWTSLGANGNTGAAQVSLAPTGFIYFRTNTSKATGSSTAVTTRMTIDDNGFVGIGNTAPARVLEIENATPVLRLTDTVSGATVVAYTEFYGADGNRTGYIGDGSTGNSNMHIVSDGGSVSASAGANSCTYTSGASWSCSSDARLKKNVEPVSGSLVKLSQLNGVTFEWIDPRNDDGRHYGFIAQDVEKIYPEMVSEDEKGMKSVDYASFVSPMIEAIKELKAHNDALAAKNAALLKRIEALEAAQ